MTDLRPPPSTDQHFALLYEEACKAGLAAARAVTPPLMIVMDLPAMYAAAAREQVGGLWFSPEGPHGCAWTRITPAGSRLCRWLLREAYAERNSDGPGVVTRHNTAYFAHSYYRARAFEAAFSNFLGNAGLAITLQVIALRD